jgi:hypothetical protein
MCRWRHPGNTRACVRNAARGHQREGATNERRTSSSLRFTPRRHPLLHLRPFSGSPRWCATGGEGAKYLGNTQRERGQAAQARKSHPGMDRGGGGGSGEDSPESSPGRRRGKGRGGRHGGGAKATGKGSSSLSVSAASSGHGGRRTPTYTGDFTQQSPNIHTRQAVILWYADHPPQMMCPHPIKY